eukprot:14902434-Heterocapsa_arctica.AAC.1
MAAAAAGAAAPGLAHVGQGSFALARNSRNESLDEYLLLLPVDPAQSPDWIAFTTEDEAPHDFGFK